MLLFRSEEYLFVVCGMSPFEVAFVVSGVLKVSEYHANDMGSFSWCLHELVGNFLVFVGEGVIPKRHVPVFCCPAV